MTVVRAAGGVVVRPSPEGINVLVIHRERYGDWTFPKGKLEPGETEEECAVREVEEETGLRCELERELPATFYADRQGRRKRVRWWRARVVGGSLAWRPEEVDDARWVTPDEARALLTYERDAALLRALDISGDASVAPAS